MLLDVGDKKYAVHFAHRQDFEVLHNEHFDSNVIGHWSTFCQVHEGICTVKGCASMTHPYFGVAACHENDQFSKKVGRKISLGRALQSMPRSLRQQIWAAYFIVCPHK